MVSIGTYDYPYIKLSRAIEIAKRICDPPFRGEITQASLASLLGVKPSGGGWGEILGALRDYGLIDGKDPVKATPMAIKIVTGTPEEGNRLRAEAFLNVSLFRRLHERFGQDVSNKELFATFLGEMAPSEPLKAREKAETIRNLYLDASPYLKYSQQEEEKPKPMPEDRDSEPSATSDIEILQLGKIKIWLPKDDPEAIKKARRLLNAYSGEDE